MTIRSRLTVWYAAVMFGSLLLMSYIMVVYVDPEHASTNQKQADERSSLTQRDQEKAREAPENEDSDEYPNRTGSAESREDAHSEFWERGRFFFWGTVPAALLAITGGWWLTRRALSPVDQLASAAEQIHGDNLGQRLPRTGNNDELDRLTAVFNDMIARLDGSFQRIREFTIHASHELKTPLTILHGEIETLQREHTLPPTLRERLGSQLDEIQRLTIIVDNLALLTRADAGQITMKFEAVAFDELVREVCEETRILAEPAKISVALRECKAVAVSGDRHRLRQLLLNLANNAVKYNDPGGSVEFALRCDGNGVELRISNTGPGITPDVLPHVFERFYRGNSTTHSAVDGCGLGLSIVQWIATAHHGSVKIESIPAKLTTVSLRLPLM